MSDLNPARLADIEAAFESGALGVYSPDHWDMAHELIAAVKQAWREREIMKIEVSEGMAGVTSLATEYRERAARAEAEVERLMHMINDGPYVPKIVKLEAVREAAERYLVSTKNCSNEFMTSAQNEEWHGAEDTLRRALDACVQDPAR